MEFRYSKPRADIRKFVSSYYDVSVPDGWTDIMRAEIANVRFVIAGSVSTDLTGRKETYGKGATLFCGPTYRASTVTFAAWTKVFGAAITPLGWARLFDVTADELADRLVPLEDYISNEQRELVRPIFNAADMAGRAAACDELFAAILDHDKRVDEQFIEQVSHWITNPEPRELAELYAQTDLSKRQVERLSRKYFGSAPKQLHCKFRALHSANKLTWQDLTDWRDVATMDYCDQSHFIREFKRFNGRTPNEFIKGAHILVRITLQERLQIAHESPFSLIG
uniref:helix-turn-helix domain-containing protein n=1 Tax=Parerythrobacter lutipelagi TaxID=1964208 RepID=UPI001375AF68|nr:AraC family transcriptional regulator [Parerythrobacter lutipelagi]